MRMCYFVLGAAFNFVVLAQCILIYNFTVYPVPFHANRGKFNAIKSVPIHNITETEADLSLNSVSFRLCAKKNNPPPVSVCLCE